MTLERKDGTPILNNATISAAQPDPLRVISFNIYESAATSANGGFPTGKTEKKLIARQNQVMRQSEVTAILARAAAP